MIRLFIAFCVLLAAFHLDAQLLTNEVHPTTAHPFGLMFSPDGDYVLCGVRGAGSASVDIFHRHGSSFEHVATQILPSQNVEGIVMLPGTDLVMFGLAEAGIGYAHLSEVEHGKAKVEVFKVETGGVAGLLAVSADGTRLYVGDEYGEGGTVRGFSIKHADRGPLEFSQLGKALTPRANAGVAISPDGKHVYATGEILQNGVPANLAGHGVPALEREGCMQNPNGKGRPNGALYTIDTSNETIVGKINAGCSPTRVIASPDGRLVYMTARGDARVLVFDAHALAKDPQHAFLRALDTGGTSPVGLAFFDKGSKLLVANSNRFEEGNGNVTVLDLKDSGATVLQTIKTGKFPRNVAPSPDGKTLAVSIAGSDQIMILSMR